MNDILLAIIHYEILCIIANIEKHGISHNIVFLLANVKIANAYFFDICIIKYKICIFSDNESFESRSVLLRIGYAHIFRYFCDCPKPYTL